MCTGRNRPNTAASFEIMLSFKSGIGKSPHFELDNGVVFGEESNENNFNSWLRTDGNNTPSHSLMTPIPLTPPEPTDANQTNGNTNAFVNALERHMVALAQNHQATQDLMRSVGALTEAINGMGNRMLRHHGCQKTHNNKNEMIQASYL